ncbi:MAG: glycosyltransferase, partial [Paludibacterium sp.]|nr:glycosyltransferase [Paludibacterium sp.]
MIEWLLAFAFYYPLFMAWLWMQGAGHYYLHYERKDPPLDQPPALPYPPISVIVPCYNEEAHVRETIGYALALDYPDFEVIAVNDGSQDATGATLDQLAAEHPRLRVIHQDPNQGKAVGLNTALLLARHEFLLCIDGDAVLDPYAGKWLMR